MEISATVSGDDAPVVTCEYDFGASPEETLKKFGADLTVKRAIAGWVVDLQGRLRTYINKCLKDNKKVDQKEVDKIASEWEPTAGPQRKSKEDKVKALIGEMTPEQKAALLADLKAA